MTFHYLVNPAEFAPEPIPIPPPGVIPASRPNWSRDWRVYRVTFQNGNSETMTGDCLAHCHLGGVAAEHVKSYELVKEVEA